MSRSMPGGDRVFISYSNRDGDTANAICDALEREGRRCWMAPRDIEPSSEWAEQIIDGINASSVMVLVFSTSSNQSPQVRREVERATHRDMPVIPFRIEQVVPIKSLEYFLSTQHWFDAFDGPLDSHVTRLCTLVRTLSNRLDQPAAAKGAIRAANPTRRADGPVYRDDDLAFITRELARQIGPIARFLVERARAANQSPSALVEALASEVTANERASFAKACRQRLDL